MRSVREAAKTLAKDTYYFVLDRGFYGIPSLFRALDDKRFLFVEVNRTELSDSLALAEQELRRRGYACDFVSLGKHRLSAVGHAVQCMRMAMRASRARAIFVCEASPAVGCLHMRKGSSVIQLWHGCGAFKKFGMSTAEKVFGASREEKQRYPEHRNASLVTVSSPEVVWAYEEAMCLEGRGVVRPLGISRTDVYFDEDFRLTAAAEVEKTVPAVCGKKVLLYAPTFRGHVEEAQAPDRLDVRLLRERLGKDWVLVMKHHPHVQDIPPIPNDCQDFAFDVTHSLSIEACMCRADACVTDYSSLVFEYALLGRPMAFFAFDLEEYDDWRGFYYSYEEMTPGPVFDVTSGLAEWVAGLPETIDPDEIEAFRDKFMSSCDGHSTERIVDAVLDL